MITRYGNFLVRFRWLVLISSILAILLLASGGRFLVFTNDYRVWFSPDNPQLVAFEELQEDYTRSDNILVMLEPKSGDVFTNNTLEAVAEFTDLAWQLPFSVRVDSITNYQHIYGEEDDLIVTDLVEEPAALDSAQLELTREIAQAQPVLVNRLLSTDSSTTGINITVELPAELTDEERASLTKEELNKRDPQIATEVTVEAARKLIDEMKAKYPDIEFSSTGVVMMNQAFPEASLKDMSTLIPMAFGVIIVGILLLIKSPIAMLATVAVILLSIMGGMGAAGWMGIKLTPASMSAPTLILTLAVADCVHFLVTYYHNLRSGSEKFAAVIESLRINFTPILLTSITTAIGFLSMNASDAPPFHDLGNITAIGVMLAFFLSVTFLPALVAVLPAKDKPGKSTSSALMDKLASFVIDYRVPLFWGMLFVMLGTALMTPRNQLNDVFVEYFDESVPFRVETDRITEKMAGMYFIDYSVDSGVDGGVSNPDFLKDVEKLENYLKEQPEVRNVSAFTETMRRLNRSMHGDDQSWYKLPENNELAAQYMLLYEMSLPYGLDLNNQINFDKSATRLSATLETLSTNNMLEFENRVTDWMGKNTPSISTSGASPTVMFSHISFRNIISMLSGTSIALVLISLLLIFALRSVKFGLISLIPNIAPALMAFGIWAMVVGQVGLAVSVVVAMTLGIVVDDTIHFLSKYLRARRERGMNAEDAVRYAFNTVGVALSVTTIVLVAGFLVIAQSNFLVNSQMGLLTAVTITLALVVDFLFLPALLIKLDKDKTVDKQSTTTDDPNPAPAMA